MVGKIHNLPTSCPCGSEFGIQYSMSCKKGGYISIGHNDLGNLTANVMSEVCKDAEIEPKLTPVSGEELWNEAGHISRLEVSGNGGNRHLSTQELSTLNPAVIAALCYEWTGKTTSLQWKNSSNRPWYI